MNKLDNSFDIPASEDDRLSHYDQFEIECRVYKSLLVGADS